MALKGTTNRQQPPKKKLCVQADKTKSLYSGLLQIKEPIKMRWKTLYSCAKWVGKGLKEKKSPVPNSELTGKTSLFLMEFQMQPNPKFPITLSAKNL